MPGRHSFRDPFSGALIAHGFVETNAPGDLKQAETDAFALEPGRWRWDGTQWVAYVPPPRPPNPLKAKIDAAVASAIPPALKDLLLAWKAQL